VAVAHGTCGEHGLDLGLSDIDSGAQSQDGFRNALAGMNCGFTGFDQCMATVSGIGGYCARNTFPLRVRPLACEGGSCGDPLTLACPTVYLDVEGLPDRDFYYLINFRVGAGNDAVQIGICRPISTTCRLGSRK
jgi:hypothetical protein